MNNELCFNIRETWRLKCASTEELQEGLRGISLRPWVSPLNESKELRVVL